MLYFEKQSTVDAIPRRRREKFVQHLRRILCWPGFDFIIGIIILVNAICIGIELQQVLEGTDSRSMFHLEFVFLAVYLLELGARFAVYGWRILCNSWVRLDIALVVTGVASAIAHGVEQKAAAESVWTALDQLMIFRLLRLLRLVRAVRMMGRWETLWKLVSGAMKGLDTLASTFTVLSAAIYIYACVAAELISRDQDLRSDPSTARIVSDNFGSMSKIALTLVQFVTLDGLADIYKPLIWRKWYLGIYFVMIFLTVSVLVMNLVTAVLVDDSIARSQMDEKMRWENKRRQYKEMVPEIKAAFHSLDLDGSGEIALNEILAADFTRLNGGVHKDMIEVLRPEVLADLYDFLDADGSGLITEEEFVDGILQMTLAETSLEIAQVKHLVKASAEAVKRVKSSVDRLQRRLFAERVRAPEGEETLRVCAADRARPAAGREGAPEKDRTSEGYVL